MCGSVIPGLRARAVLLLAALAAGFPAGLHAASDSDTFQVTATVVAACSITANDLDFGAYSPVSGITADAATLLEISCTNGAPYEVGLSAGTTPGGMVSQRLMTDGTHTLSYNLYIDAARTNVWGETPGLDTLAGTGTGVLQLLTVYGRLPGSQSVPAGSYADTVTATITF